jgi:hypothetical protein
MKNIPGIHFMAAGNCVAGSGGRDILLIVKEFKELCVKWGYSP